MDSVTNSMVDLEDIEQTIMAAEQERISAGSTWFGDGGYLPPPFYAGNVGQSGTYTNNAASIPRQFSFASDAGAHYNTTTASSEAWSSEYTTATATTDATAVQVAQDYQDYQTCHRVPGYMPCELVGLQRCDSFHLLKQRQGWIEHIEEHFDRQFPSICICWFCNVEFIASETSAGDERANFQMRLHHIFDHLQNDDMTSVDMRPDFHVVDFLYKRHLIDEEVYNFARKYHEGPPRPHYGGTDYEDPATIRRREREAMACTDLQKEKRDEKKANKQRKGHGHGEKKSGGKKH